MLISQVDLNNHQKILDLACGTGTLSIGIKKRIPGAEIFAIDADEKILKMARKKAEKFDAKINFNRGFSDQLPYPDESFDLVFSTLSFHHLMLEGKIKTIKEILRVLKNDGKFHIADYGFPLGRSQKVFSNFIRIIDGKETTADNLNGRLGFLMEENGFAKVERTGHFNTILGTIRLFRASKYLPDI
jgi:ubiquinone/menaquinone biosynthesis C-methylase UbiE